MTAQQICCLMPSAMSKEPTKPAVKSASIQEEVYLRLIEAAANQGAFNLGELKSGDEAQKIGKHLRGVSEILSLVWEEK